MLVKCVVTCRDSNGTPTFYPVRINCPEGEYREGGHYDGAREAAEDANYQDPGLVYDEFDGPAWLFQQFDWLPVLVKDFRTTT